MTHTHTVYSARTRSHEEPPVTHTPIVVEADALVREMHAELNEGASVGYVVIGLFCVAGIVFGLWLTGTI